MLVTKTKNVSTLIKKYSTKHKLLQQIMKSIDKKEINIKKFNQFDNRAYL